MARVKRSTASASSSTALEASTHASSLTSARASTTPGPASTPRRVHRKKPSARASSSSAGRQEAGRSAPPRKKRKTPADGHCTNCGCDNSDTAMWRTPTQVEGQRGPRLCSACGLYWTTHRRHRPPQLWPPHLQPEGAQSEGSDDRGSSTSGDHRQGSGPREEGDSRMDQRGRGRRIGRRSDADVRKGKGLMHEEVAADDEGHEEGEDPVRAAAEGLICLGEVDRGDERGSVRGPGAGLPRHFSSPDPVPSPGMFLLSGTRFKTSSAPALPATRVHPRPAWPASDLRTPARHLRVEDLLNPPCPPEPS